MPSITITGYNIIMKYQDFKTASIYNMCTQHKMPFESHLLYKFRKPPWGAQTASMGGMRPVICSPPLHSILATNQWYADSKIKHLYSSIRQSKRCTWYCCCQCYNTAHLVLSITQQTASHTTASVNTEYYILTWCCFNYIRNTWCGIARIIITSKISWHLFCTVAAIWKRH